MNRQYSRGALVYARILNRTVVVARIYKEAP